MAFRVAGQALGFTYHYLFLCTFFVYNNSNDSNVELIGVLHKNKP